MEQPVHVIGITIYPKTAEDAAKLRAALPRLVEEDPTLAYRIDPDPERARLVGTSETHLEIAIDRLIRGFGVQVSVREFEIAYRETITKTVEYDYTHRKQTGGAGQFARVKIRFEPLPRGSGFEFANEPSAARYRRVRVGRRRGSPYPAPSPRLWLPDHRLQGHAGRRRLSRHRLNAQTFEIAARACFREGMAKAGPQLLEPS